MVSIDVVGDCIQGLERIANLLNASMVMFKSRCIAYNLNQDLYWIIGCLRQVSQYLVSVPKGYNDRYWNSEYKKTDDGLLQFISVGLEKEVKFKWSKLESVPGLHPHVCLRLADLPRIFSDLSRSVAMWQETEEVTSAQFIRDQRSVTADFKLNTQAYLLLTSLIEELNSLRFFFWVYPMMVSPASEQVSLQSLATMLSSFVSTRLNAYDQGSFSEGLRQKRYHAEPYFLDPNDVTGVEEGYFHVINSVLKQVMALAPTYSQRIQNVMNAVEGQYRERSHNRIIPIYTQYRSLCGRIQMLSNEGNDQGLRQVAQDLLNLHKYASQVPLAAGLRGAIQSTAGQIIHNLENNPRR